MEFTIRVDFNRGAEASSARGFSRRKRRGGNSRDVHFHEDVTLRNVIVPRARAVVV